MVESYDTYDRCSNQFVSAVYCVLYLVCVRLTRSGRSEPRQRGTSVISEVAASSRLTAGDAESVEEGGNMIGRSLHEANKSARARVTCAPSSLSKTIERRRLIFCVYFTVSAGRRKVGAYRDSDTD